MIGLYGFRVMFASDKVILTREASFIGMGYANNKIYMLILMNNDSNMSFDYSCGVEFIFHINTHSVWHYEFGYIGKRTMNRMLQSD